MRSEKEVLRRLCETRLKIREIREDLDRDPDPENGLWDELDTWETSAEELLWVLDIPKHVDTE